MLTALREDLRVEHPGIVLRDGPTGWRAALRNGPDVWEVIRALGEIDEPGDQAIPAVAELLNLSASQVHTALRYYLDHSDEIDGEIGQNRAEAEAAHQAWQMGALMETLDLLATPGALEEIRQAEVDLAAGRGVDADELRRQLVARAKRESQTEP
jgi:hypothetical protein